MMHEKSCNYCKKANYYYDDKIKISSGLHKEVSEKLHLLMGKLGMISNSKAKDYNIEMEDASSLSIGSPQLSLIKNEMSIDDANK